jgi:hypothetical protein
MEFYSLVKIDSEKLIADIVEFENNQYAFYCYDTNNVCILNNKQELHEYILKSYTYTKLIKDNVSDDEEEEDKSNYKIMKAMDILYSA